MMKGLSSPVAILLAAALAAGAASAQTTINQDHDQHILYVWAGDQARVAPDLLAVINFDEDSPNYGKVIRTVPIPPPGNVGNEPHHCHLSADHNILGCGGLLSLLHGQNGIFFLASTTRVTRNFSSPPARRNRVSRTLSCRSKAAASW
jgi:56kDa selenium binding protein (SBP56)